jgi:NAD(P)-dependent dehydrogenase (short-subunit alcohol dehydrogenase family)
MSDPLFDMAGRVVVVTGGGGRLGGHFAATLAGRGARVAVFDLDDGAGAGDSVLEVACDVTDRQSLDAALARVEDHWEAPHGLINCAAIDSPPDAPLEENGPFETYPEASWDAVMTVNTKGVVLACQVVGGRMAQLGRGSIVNVGSIYGMVSPDQGLYEYRRRRGENFYKPVAYAASKSALYNLTRYLATYWGAAGVRVNIVTFGGVFDDQEAEFVDAYAARVPLGRMADAADYDGAVVFLLSEASRYMTGANLVIDGGWTAW